MVKTYVLIYSEAFGPREAVKVWADTCPLVRTWRYDLPHSIYLVSEATATQLSAELDRVFGEAAHHLITEVNGNTDGRLPKATWHFFYHKATSPEAVV